MSLEKRPACRPMRRSTTTTTFTDSRKSNETGIFPRPQTPVWERTSSKLRFVRAPSPAHDRPPAARQRRLGALETGEEDRDNSDMVIKGRVRNGVVVLATGSALPEGAQVVVLCPPQRL